MNNLDIQSMPAIFILNFSKRGQSNFNTVLRAIMEGKAATNQHEFPSPG